MENPPSTKNDSGNKMNFISKMPKPVKIAIFVSIGFVALLVVKKIIYSKKIPKDTHSNAATTMLSNASGLETTQTKARKLQSDVKEEEPPHVRQQSSEAELKEDITVSKEISSKLISHPNLITLLTTDSSESHVVIDVRDPNIDFVGGHIAKCINVPSSTFYDSLPSIFKKYNNKSIFILICMYGAHRSLQCMGNYKKAINEIIENYNKETGLSFYYMYTKKPSELSVNKKKIDIECDELMYNNLCKQRLYVVKDGFFGFLNNSKVVDKNNKDIVVDFDKNQWKELSVLNEKKLYHQKEYFDTGTFGSSVAKKQGTAKNT